MWRGPLRTVGEAAHYRAGSYERKLHTRALCPLLLGADVWAVAPRAVYWLIFWGFVAAIVLFAVVRWSRRPGNSRVARYVNTALAGRALARAQGELDEIARFEGE